MTCKRPVYIKPPQDLVKVWTLKGLGSWQVPCGKCWDCMKRRQHQWAFRLQEEQRVSETAVFLTLTYGENLDKATGEIWGSEPYVQLQHPDSPNRRFKPRSELPIRFDTTLVPKHPQNFLKRLRKANAKEFAKEGRDKSEIPSIKYYLVGEYGNKFGRPHYHAIIFNIHPNILRNRLRLSKDIWTYGQTDVAKVSLASINYVVGYILQGKLPQEPLTELQIRPFARQSKGLGRTYLSDHQISYHQERLEFTVRHNGYNIPMPRYYRDRIFDADDRRRYAEGLQEMHAFNQEQLELNPEAHVNWAKESDKRRFNRQLLNSHGR
jgi:hypothetical protein